MHIEKSLHYQEKAKKIIPGISQLTSKRPNVFSLGVWPAYYSRAKGAEIWDLDNNHYVDMSISGGGANILGYADDDVDSAVIQALKKGSSSSLNCSEEVDLAEDLCRLHPWAEKVRFARSGGEAAAIAIRIARAHTHRQKIAICGYHGWHDWCLALDPSIRDLSKIGVPNVLRETGERFEYNDIQGLKRIVNRNKKSLAAIIMEPVRDISPLPGFLDGVKVLAREAGAVLIMNEITSGFRLNTGGAHLYFKITPDMAVFSKALGNGYPVAAVLGQGGVMSVAEDARISSTMWTERIGSAAALAMIRKFEKYNVSQHLIATGKKVQEGWLAAARESDVRIKVQGIPPISRFSFIGENHPVKKAYFVQEMIDHGFLTSNVFCAMLAHRDEHVSAYIIAVKQVFRKMAELERGGVLEAHLRGSPSVC